MQENTVTLPVVLPLQRKANRQLLHNRDTLHLKVQSTEKSMATCLIISQLETPQLCFCKREVSCELLASYQSAQNWVKFRYPITVPDQRAALLLNSAVKCHLAKIVKKPILIGASACCCNTNSK